MTERGLGLVAGLTALQLAGCTCISLDELQSGVGGGAAGDAGAAGPGGAGPGPGGGSAGGAQGGAGGAQGGGSSNGAAGPGGAGPGAGPSVGGAGGGDVDAYDDCVLGDMPALYYRMDSMTPTETNLGTFGGSATYVGDVIAAPALAAPFGGLTAKKFNANATLEEQTSMLMGGTQHVSIEVWVRVGSTMSVAGPAHNIFDTSPVVAELGIQPRFDQTGMDQLYFAIQDGARQAYDNGNFIQQPMEAFHVVAVYRQSSPPPTTSDDMVIYVDGVLTSLAATGSSVAMGAMQTLRIGGAGFGSAADGAVLDEFALYTYELTPAQISKHYVVGTTGVCN